MKKLIFFFMCFVFCKANSQSLTDDLLVYYPFDGNVIDNSDNNYDGTVFGTSFGEDRFGNPNSAAYFDGINDYINFPNIMELKPDLPVSFSFWVKYSDLTYENSTVFNTSFEENINSGVYMNIQSSTGKYQISYGDGSNSYTPSSRRTYASNDIIQPNEWHHIAIVVSSALNMKIYIDCEEYGGNYSGSGGPLQYSSLPGTIGRHDRSLNNLADYFKGAIDDFRYWNRELTDDDIYELLGINYSIVNFSNPTGCNSDDGMITLSGLISGNNYTITYVLNSVTETLNFTADSSGAYIISGLESGIYDSITITQDLLGCPNDLGQIILNSTDLMGSIAYTNPTSCDETNGIITISGLSPNTEYVLTYDDGSAQSVTQFSNDSGAFILTGLSSGTYSNIVITDLANNCSDDLEAVILESPSLDASISFTNPTACDETNGIITISGLSPNTEYVLTYDDGSAQSVTQFSNVSGAFILTGLSSGTYSNIVITDSANNCSDDLETVILESPSLDASISFTNPTACDVNDGMISISGLSPNTEYILTYDDGSSQSSTQFSDVSGDFILTGLSSGTYSNIVITDLANNCSDDLEAVILESPSLDASISFANPTACDVNDGMISISGLSPNTEYILTYDDGSSQSSTQFSDVSGDFILTGLSSGTYSNIIITDSANNCSDDLETVILESPSLDASISFTNPTACDVNDGMISISGLSPNTEYVLTYEDGSVQYVIEFSDGNGIVVLSNLESGIYSSIVITHVDSNCTEDLGTLELTCEDVFECFRIKKFFTPNGDSYNDYWYVDNLSSTCDFVLHIFNRNGKLLKTLTPNNNKWDGTYNGALMPSNDYWYLIKYRHDDGQELEHRSHFTLIR